MDVFDNNFFGEFSSFGRNPFQNTHHVAIRPPSTQGFSPVSPVISTRFFQQSPFANDSIFTNPNQNFPSIFSNEPLFTNWQQPSISITQRPFGNWQEPIYQQPSIPATQRPIDSRQEPIYQQPSIPATQRPIDSWQEPIYQQPSIPATQRPIDSWQEPIYQQPSIPAIQRPFGNWQEPIYQQPSIPATQRLFGSWHEQTTPLLWLVTGSPTMRPNVQDPSVTADGDTMYLQILITSDFETYTAHGSNKETLAKYMAAFWIAVDLRYRELSNPKIRLNIAGLIIPQSSDAAPYMNKNVTQDNVVQSRNTLRTIGSYFFKETKFSSTMYDVVAAISNRNLGDIGDDGIFHDDVSCIAEIETVCQRRFRQSAALIRDKRGFEGITTAAHELGHTMGAPHDGDASWVVPGEPCPWSDGYLMSYEHDTVNSVHWSQCSVTAMRNYLRDNGQCLNNKPDVGKPYSKILPGRILSRDEQCRRSMGMVSYKEEESNCAVLWCMMIIGSYIRMQNHKRPLAEGSYCGQ